MKIYSINRSKIYLVFILFVFIPVKINAQFWKGALWGIANAMQNAANQQQRNQYQYQNNNRSSERSAPKTEVTKEHQIESDGFTWYEIRTRKDYKSTFSALSENGNTLIPQGKYDLIVYHTTNDGWFGVHKDGKEGVYTKEGRMICDAIYDNASYHKNDDGIYIEVKKDGKTGVIDEYGKFIITPSSLYTSVY